jgi:diguanylate cyclase (GGDEF)-like protein/PAS domain S-box-containing protein
MATDIPVVVPVLPPGETAGALALRTLAILDTPSEETFDRITRLAARLTGATASFLLFVDNGRFWAKSTYGMSLHELPHQDCFSLSAILGEGCLTVLDSHADARFARNVSARASGSTRFYAGVPVMMSGQPVGTLCVSDTKPRRRFPVSAEQNLLSLAAIVSEQLELKLLRAGTVPTNHASSVGEERYALASLAAWDGFWDWDIESGIVYYSPHWQAILGMDETERIDRLSHWIGRVHHEDRAQVIAQLTAHRTGRTSSFRSEHRIRHADGTWRWVLSRGHSLETSGGKATRMAGSMADVTESKTADPLTGLPNRLSLLDQIEKRLEQAATTGDWSFGVIFVDLNRFHQVNETLGERGGDATLIEAGTRLCSAARRTLKRDDFVVARVGGAKFILLLEGVKTDAMARETAASITVELSRSFEYQDAILIPSASMGIAMGASRYLHPEEILRDAETAMSQAKNEGAGGCIVFTTDMHERSAGRLQLYSNLRRAIDERELVLHYQPEIDLKSNEVIGFEALVRWNHPMRGLIPPSDFIPLAEETGLILPLGDWGMAEACRQLVAWRAISGTALDLRMSVNLSAKEFARPGLLERVSSVLANSGLGAESLRLEVTESSLMNDSDAALSTMRELREMGIGLHLDDFGTGYSSLNYLHRYPFDTLKIDRSFIQRLCDHKQSVEIVRTILYLADSLEMEVVAEGIETLPQLDQLKNLGCKYGQGFYFARALTAEAVEAALPSLRYG